MATQEQVDAMDAQVQSLITAVSQVSSDLSTAVTNIQQQLNTLETEIENKGVSLDISGLQEDIGNLTTAIAPLDAAVQEAGMLQPQAFQATKAKMGANMAGSITVDTTNETVSVVFDDDKGNVAVAPEGATATWASDNPAVATVAADFTNSLVGNVTPLTPGTANISATGSGWLEADGVTEIPDPAPAVVTVAAGPANTAVLVESV